MRPKKIICVFPITSFKKIGWVGRKMFLFCKFFLFLFDTD